jgi:hypothetical protein
VQRESYRDAKARTLLEIAAEVLGPSAELSGVRLVDDLGVVHTSPAVVLVSNNPYARRRRRRGGLRPALDSGRLGVLVLYRPSGPPGPPGRGWTARSLEVTMRLPRALTERRSSSSPPIHFTVRPVALRVRIPISR